MQRLQQNRHALGSQAILTIVVPDDFSSDETFTNLWKQVESFEQRFSRFLPDSELTKFNHAAGRTVPLSREFLALLRTAKALAEDTNGLYNPLILPALNKAGYKGSWPNPAAFDEKLDYADRHLAPVAQIEIAETTGRIPVHTAVDFGGIGKGYLLDRLADWLEGQQVTNYWLSLGGDIVCNGYDVTGDAWHVGVQHATHESELVGELSNEGKRLAIATSGTTKRRGEQQGKPWHHLIDPRTGEPAQTDIVTATITAPRGVAADVFAKCIVILGSQAAPSFIEELNIPQVLIQIEADQDIIIVKQLGVTENASL